VTEKPFIISFPEASSGEANHLAGSLTHELRDIDPGLSVEQHRDRNDALDFGATVAVILGTASVNAIGHGIARWLSRQGGARIEISESGHVIASGLESTDAARIAEALNREKGPS
jgi:hypothetical protein